VRDRSRSADPSRHAPRLYELKLSSDKRNLANIRPVARIIEEIERRNAKPLRETRVPLERMPCVCWHFSSFTAAILRKQGVPARARCGFGAYFNPGRYSLTYRLDSWDNIDRAERVEYGKGTASH
jgi:hypothetical protein